MLQQYLPLAVLKRKDLPGINSKRWLVATVLTACGIETHNDEGHDRSTIVRPVATVLTACGIETWGILRTE